MSYLYVCEQGSEIHCADGRIRVKLKTEDLRSVPSETVEVIEVFGNVQVTTQCMRYCMMHGINVIFYSTTGKYFGKLVSTGHVNVGRQRLQGNLTDEFKLTMARNIVAAKIHNQSVILRRYARNRGLNVNDQIDTMNRYAHKLDLCSQTDEIMGYEGAAARIYFQVLGLLIDSQFPFDKRTRQPPLDPFNSLISLGYTILLNEIHGKLEAKGLNPYFGVLHQDREKHPTLASDLMEEWRAVIVDSVAMSMLNGHELAPQDFYKDEESGGVFLEKNAFKSYVNKLEAKFHADNNYLSYVEYRVSFRRALDLQAAQFCKAIENNDPNLYKPIQIR